MARAQCHEDGGPTIDGVECVCINIYGCYNGEWLWLIFKVYFI